LAISLMYFFTYFSGRQLVLFFPINLKRLPPRQGSRSR
jgi:hypothetical protein